MCSVVWRATGGFMTCTVEVSLVGLSLVILLGSPLEYPNIGAVLGFLFGSMNEIISSISLGSTRVSLLGSIWHITWCRPWIGSGGFL